MKGCGRRAAPSAEKTERGGAGAAARDAVGLRRRSAAGSTALKTPR